MSKINWQRNFFDHRQRCDESLAEKFKYIRQNPVRAGLITPSEAWSYAIDVSGLDSKIEANAHSAGD
jgi:hypothetical protein